MKPALIILAAVLLAGCEAQAERGPAVRMGPAHTGPKSPCIRLPNSVPKETQEKVRARWAEQCKGKEKK